MHIPTKIRLEPPVVMDMPVLKAARDEEGPRRCYLKKGFFQEHGYTAGCEGCSRLSGGITKGIVHREECRERMYVELQKTDKGRKWLERAKDKITEYLETKHEEFQEEERKKQGTGKEEAPGSTSPKRETTENHMEEIAPLRVPGVQAPQR